MSSVLSVREVTRKRIIDDMVRAAQPQGKWRIMVVDSNSLKTLNAVCKMYDILEQNITLVENIERKRQNNMDYEAIYFISPTLESVSGLINDFANKPMYQAAHVFFTGALSERLFEKIKRSGITSYLRKLIELNVDFLAQEAQVFSLDLPYSLRVLFNSYDAVLVQQHLSMVAKKLVSVCATLGEYPTLRYYDPKAERRSLSARLAFMVQEELDNLCRLDTDFPPKTPFPRATMIILDRSFDMITPLLHEFTYQAMANDLLPTDGANRFVYGKVASAQDGPPGPPVPDSVATVEETDPLWVKYRHTHIAECIQNVINEFQKFMEENPAAKSAGGTLNTGDSIASLKMMKDLIYAMPQFQEGKSKYSIHINLCQECMGYYAHKKLEKLAAVEQDLATGETGEGKSIKNIEVDMVPVLSDPDVSATDKLRILMTYIISKDGIADADRSKLLSCAQLSLEESQAITNLHLMGVKLSSGLEKRKDGKPKYSYQGVTAWERTKKKKEEEKYILSRWVPIMKHVMEDAITNKLEKSIFPYTKDPPVEAQSPSSTKATSAPVGGPGQVASLRTTKPSWAKRSAGDRGTTSDGKEKPVEAVDLRKNGSRVIVFSVGGMCFSEIRSAYELVKDYARDVIIGSTHSISSIELVDQLKDLHRPPADGRGGLRDPRWGGAQGYNDGILQARSSSVGGLNDLSHEQRKESRNEGGRKGLFGFGKK